ncbi:MAG: TonB-dependent receptor [Sphingobacterium sp.]|jgi:iron complex outermembrane receptor protein|nr:TonB-dependent receptor [Sphingobacterium sp.]
MKTIIVLIAQWALYTSIFAYGQNCNLTLKVQLIDAENHQPIGNAQLYLNNNTRPKEASPGKYVFQQLCKGASSLYIDHSGYKKKEANIKISQDTAITIVLKKDVQQLEAVTVTANAQVSAPHTSITLSKEQRQESQGKNLAGVLSEIAGVNTLKTGANNGKPVINGLYGNRLLLINHGVRHESQQWGTDHAPEVDPFSAEEITVIKSSDAVRFGPDALGGVIKISPSAIVADRKAQSSHAILFNSNGRGLLLNNKLEGTVGQFSYRAGITTGKQGNLKSADYYLGNTGNEELHGNFFASYKTGKNTFKMYLSHFGNTLGVFQGAHIGSKEDILARIEHGRPFEEYSFSYKIGAPKQRVTHQLAKLEYLYQLDENSQIQAQYSIQRNHRKEFDLRRVAENDVPMADILLNTQQLELVYSRPSFMAGISGNLQVNNNVPGTGSTPIIPNFDNHGLGAFVSVKVPFKSYLLETGVRYDYKFFDAAGYQYDYSKITEDGLIPQYLMTDRKHFHNISGVAGISQRVNAVFTWKSNLGLAWRAPSANELYSDGIHHGTGTYEVGNKNLKSEKGLKWINSLSMDKGFIKANVDLFAQVIENYIYSQPVPDSTRQTIRGTFPLFQYRQDRAFFYGADLSTLADINQNWQYGLNISIVKAKNVTKDEFLPNIPAWKLQQHLSYRFAPNQILSYIKIKHHFQAKQTRYEPNSDFAAPPAAYHLFDAVLASSIKLKSQRTAEFQLAVDNVFNEAYKDYMDRFRYYAHALGRNVSLKVNFTF